MQLPIVGPSYKHASQDINWQRCINMFLTSSGPDGRGKTALLPTPGLSSIVSSGGSEVRAIMAHGDNLYAVIDNTCYTLTFDTDAISGTLSSIGTLSTSSGPISWDINPTQIMIVDGSTNGYIITVATDTFAAISDADFTGGVTVVFFDSYFIYNTPDASTMYATALNDGSDITATDFGTAEGKPDKLVGLAVDKRELWAFGEKTVEIWYDAANSTGFPFSRREGAYVDLGCSAAHSIVNIDNTLVWLDHRRYVVQAQGYNPVVLSDEAVSKEFQTYKTVNDAIAYEYVDRGHLFYIITFPTEKKTWAYDLLTGSWHERAYFDQNDNFTRQRQNCHLKYKSFDLVGDYTNGNIYHMSSDYYDDNGDPIHRLRTTSHQNMEFAKISVSEVALHMESGKGLVTGTGNDPQVMLRYSNDGGYTWSHELPRSIGKLGEYDKQIRWNRLGMAREWLFEFRISDPIKFSIIDASVRISGGLH